MTRLTRAATSSRRWLEISMAAPSCLSASSSKKTRRASGSRLAAGSSRTRRSASRPRAMAIRSFCFWPPESLTKGWRREAFRVQAQALGHLRHALAGPRRTRRAAKRTNWPTGILSGGGNWGTKPIRARTSWRLVRGASPSTVTCPRAGTPPAGSGSGWSCRPRWSRPGRPDGRARCPGRSRRGPGAGALEDVLELIMSELQVILCTSVTAARPGP